MMSAFRTLLVFALCSPTFAADDPDRIASIAEVRLFPVEESATVRFSDEHGVEWRLRLSNGEGKHWSVTFGPIPKAEGEMAPLVEQSDSYRKKLLVMLSDFCSREESSGALSQRLLPSLKALAEEILKEPNQSPQRKAGSRPSSDDTPTSETPFSLGPRG